MADGEKKFYESKKFWMTIAGLVSVLVPMMSGMIPPESRVYGILGMVGAAATYVLAQGKVDAAKEANKP